MWGSGGSGFARCRKSAETESVDKTEGGGGKLGSGKSLGLRGRKTTGGKQRNNQFGKGEKKGRREQRGKMRGDQRRKAALRKEEKKRLQRKKGPAEGELYLLGKGKRERDPKIWARKKGVLGGLGGRANVSKWDLEISTSKDPTTNPPSTNQGTW